MSISLYYEKAVQLLQNLISIPSYSREEDQTAAIIQEWFKDNHIETLRVGNNVYAIHPLNDPNKPTLLLNSHHDTVKPANGYSKDPFNPEIAEGKLFGLGSNDAGGSLVALAATFLYFYHHNNAAYNLIFSATAEEEVSGTNGIELLLAQLKNIDCAIVGEPTLMKMAVAERGLMVLDVEVTGAAGHAARNEGQNAIYKALEEIQWFKDFKFPKYSDLLGPVSMNVTSMDTPNKLHNMVPDVCKYTVDIRLNEYYTHQELLGIIESHISSAITPRSMRLKSSSISLDHDLVKRGEDKGIPVYGSPTLSDKALIPFPALKIGPGDSARSHTADEFIYLKEIKEGIEIYIDLLIQK